MEETVSASEPTPAGHTTRRASDGGTTRGPFGEIEHLEALETACRRTLPYLLPYPSDPLTAHVDAARRAIRARLDSLSPPQDKRDRTA